MQLPSPVQQGFNAFVLAVVMALLQSVGQAQVLTHCVPGAVSPGKTTEIALHGSKLDGPVRVWTSFPAKVEIVPDNPKGRTQLTCTLTLPDDAPVGVGGIIVSTIHGSCDPLLMMIDDLPSVAESGKNNTPQSAQEVTLPAAVDGRSSGTVFDYYRFAAKAGQRMSLEVVATRLGSDFDPVVRLLDSTGQELQTVDDDAGLGADCRLTHTFAADGNYTLEVRDNAYKANGRYRLRLGDFPLVSTAFPLGVRQGSTAQVSAAGPLVDSGIRSIVLSPNAAAGNQLPFSVKLPGSQASGFTLLATSELPEETEDISLASNAATALVLPTAVSGRLETPGDADYFDFPAVKGARLRLQGVTRSLGSPALLVLRLHAVSADGKVGAKLAESGLGGGEEETLTAIVPESGVYRLAVEDLLGRGGADFTYRIEGRCGASFDLSYKIDKALKTARLKLALPGNGGAFYVDVQCQRSGYDGPIVLSLDAPRPGWQLVNHVIPAKAAETRLYIIAPSDLAASEFVPLRIMGRATDNTCTHVATMSTLAQLRAAHPTVPYPPAWHDGLVQVSGTADEAAFYTLAADKTEVEFPRLVGQAKLTLTMERTSDKFKDVPLVVLPLDLPPGITAEVKRNGNGKSETYDILLKGPKDLSDAPRSFRYFAYAELAGAGRAVVSPPIALRAITPLAVSLAAAEPLTPGQKQKVKLTLVRAGSDKQPVEVKLKNLPKGVTASDKVTIAPDQSEAEIELTAAADAAVGKFAELAAVATSKYAGQDISVESASATLEVKAP